MARFMVTTLGLLAAAEANSEQVLFQRRGVAVKSGTQTQLAMVETLAREVAESKRPLTDGEKSILDTIDKEIIATNLDDITNDDKADEVTLQSAADAVAACESELDGKIKTASDMDANAKSEWAKHASCRAEQARLKGEMEAAKGRLDDFLSESKAQLPSCAIPGAEAAVEDAEKFMDAQAAWYANHDKTYGEKLNDWNTRIATHAAKVQECDAQQDKAQQATCAWRSYVLVSQGEYASCRVRTLKVYADTLATNKDNSENHKTEWEAMKRLQCYISTLRGDIEATGSALSHCETESVDTTALDVIEPTVAGVAQGKLDGMGDMSKDYGCAA